MRCVHGSGLIRDGGGMKAKKKCASYGCANEFTPRPHSKYPENAHCPECMQKCRKSLLKLVSANVNPS